MPLASYNWEEEILSLILTQWVCEYKKYNDEVFTETKKNRLFHFMVGISSFVVKQKQKMDAFSTKTIWFTENLLSLSALPK